MEPKTRKEHYLAKIAGEDVSVPEPKTRQEYYLKEIAENGGGGGGDEPVVIDVVTNDTFTQVISVDITPEELSAAIEAKKRIYIAPHSENYQVDEWYAVSEMTWNDATVCVASVSVMFSRLSSTLDVRKILLMWHKERQWIAMHEIKNCSIATS